MYFILFFVWIFTCGVMLYVNHGQGQLLKKYRKLTKSQDELIDLLKNKSKLAEDLVEISLKAIGDLRLEFGDDKKYKNSKAICKEFERLVKPVGERLHKEIDHQKEKLHKTVSELIEILFS